MNDANSKDYYSFVHVFYVLLFIFIIFLFQFIRISVNTIVCVCVCVCAYELLIFIKVTCTKICEENSQQVKSHDCLFQKFITNDNKNLKIRFLYSLDLVIFFIEE